MHYDSETLLDLRTIYVCMMIFWGFLICILRLYNTDLIGYLIILFPVVVFFISYVSLPCIDESMHSSMCKANVISFGLLVTAVLISWFKDKVDVFMRPLQMMVVSVIVLMISLIDIWTSVRNVPLTLHFRTSLQTIALTLLSLALYEFYVEVSTNVHRYAKCNNSVV